MQLEFDTAFLVLFPKLKIDIIEGTSIVQSGNKIGHKWHVKRPSLNSEEVILLDQTCQPQSGRVVGNAANYNIHQLHRP